MDDLTGADPQGSAAPDAGAIENASQGDSGGGGEVSTESSSTSFGDAFARALEKQGREDANSAGKADAAPVEQSQKTERQRNPDGTFAAGSQPDGAPVEGQQAPDAQQQQNPGIHEPPARFSPDAKAAWAQAPEAIRGEVNRAISELETGLQTYQQKMQAYEPINEYMEMAQRGGTTLDQALHNYVGIENQLRADPMAGLEAILGNMDMTPLEYAQRVMAASGQMEGGEGQQSQQFAAYEKFISQQNQRIAQLEQAQMGITQNFQQQQEQMLQRHLSEFAQQNPRFEELWPSMQQLIAADMAQDLPQAYEMATRLKPAPAQVSPTAAPAVNQEQPNRAAQTGKGKLSVTGAPSSGSNPANRKPPASFEEAMARAASQTGASL